MFTLRVQSIYHFCMHIEPPTYRQLPWVLTSSRSLMATIRTEKAWWKAWLACLPVSFLHHGQAHQTLCSDNGFARRDHLMLAAGTSRRKRVSTHRAIWRAAAASG